MAALAVVCALSSAGAPAQQLPGIGDVLRGVEKTRPEATPQRPPSVDVEKPARPALEGSESVRFRVDRFVVTGVSAFPESEVLAQVAPFTGRELNLLDLSQATSAITRFYRDRGYLLARAYVPAQEIRDGVVELAVLEGRYGRIEPRLQAPLSERLVAEALEPLRPGDVIQEGALDRSLLLLDDLGGISARGTLKPGEQTGRADLVVDVTAGQQFGGTVSADNYGTSYTGQGRAGGSFVARNLAGLGDTLELRGLISERTDLAYGQAAYDVPLTGDGLRAGALATYTTYTLGQRFSSLDATGEATIGTGYLRYALIRSRSVNLNAQLAVDYKDLQDEVRSTSSVNPRNEWVSTVTLFGDVTDGLLAGGVTSGSVAVGIGSLDVQDFVAAAIDDATAKTAGNFRKVNYSLVRLQDLARGLQVYAAVSGQLASKNLDPVEQFSLGGPFGVRAYPTGEAPGDEGILGTLELRYLLPLTGSPVAVQLVGFIDSGNVQINKNPFSAAQNSVTLTGAGVGANLFGWEGFQLRASFAWKLSSADATSDTDKSGRGWIQLIKLF